MTRQAGRPTRLRAGSVAGVALVAMVVVLSGDVVSTTDGFGTQPGPRPRLGAASRAVEAPTGAETVTDSPEPSASQVAPQGPPDLEWWPWVVAQALDTTTLEAGGVVVPYGGNVLAARVFGGGPSPAYQFFEAGGGGFSQAFYPASAIKLLAALGALDFARSVGFSGEATLDEGSTIHDVYDNAIRYSSNDDYSELVRIAGLDRLNRDFLPAHGFPTTVIQEAYGGWDQEVAYSPAMVLAEGGEQADVPERDGGHGDYGCGGRNCSDLFDLVDAVRRVVLDAEIPAGERFAIAPSDVAGLQDALLGASSWVEPGVREAFGPDALIFSKPGWVGGLDCVDAAVVADRASGATYLLGISLPDYDYNGCDAIASVAYDALTVLAPHDRGEAVRTDGSRVTVDGGRQVALASGPLRP